MLSIKNLSFNYHTTKTFQFQDFQTSQEPLLILGPSGCGKTTLLHLLAGILKPNEGSISWGNQNICELNNKQLDTLRGQTIGLIFQKNHFISAYNVLENICLQAKINSVSIDNQLLENLLIRLNINHLKERSTQQLSEGEKQRVSIARALICQPKYILADEPTSALDDQNANEVIALLTSESKNFDTQVVIITHDQRLKDKFNNRIEL